MTETSINGWPVISEQADPRLKQFLIPGSNRHIRLHKDAAPILLYIGGIFHKRIANLDTPPLAVWGYNYRQARQSPVWSDHASGTAADYRSDKFPIGTQHMTVKQRLIVKWCLRRCEGLVAWGGDYMNAASKDQMHFAIAPGVKPEQIKAWQKKWRITDAGYQLK